MSIKRVTIKNYGPIGSADCGGLGKLNLLIGTNGSGKTFFLKALYTALKTTEQYQRGKETRTANELLEEALYWTFQVGLIGDLVTKGEGNLVFSMQSEKGKEFSYSFGSSTKKQIKSLSNTFAPTDVNSIFIPAKEAISLQDVILRSYDIDKEFGFDKTYVDLARALSRTVKGRNYKSFSEARKSLNQALGGRIEFDTDRKSWVFRDNARRTFDINTTSEGIKHLGILDLLLGNHYLKRGSVVIIDEVEANLHPGMIYKFMEILVQLAKDGIQIFLSTHSYFVIKSLYILAHKKKMSIPVLSFTDGKVKQSDLKEEMPDNPIVEESIKLYEKELEL